MDEKKPANRIVLAPLPRVRVYLKSRKNPPKKDGSQTISYTLQWCDDDGKDRYESLGTGITEEDAKRQKKERERKLNSYPLHIVSEPVVPEDEVLKLQCKAPKDYETLVLAFGPDPRSWPVWEWSFRNPEGHLIPHEYSLLQTVAKVFRGETRTTAPQFARCRLKWQNRAAHDLLCEDYQGEIGLEEEIEKRLELCCFENGEEDCQSVIDELIGLAKERSSWSSDPDEFEEQFRKRYPEEYDKVSNDLTTPIKIREYMARATDPPEEIAKKLLIVAHGGKVKIKESKTIRPVVFWGASSMVEQKGKRDEQSASSIKEAKLRDEENDQ